MQLAPKAIPSEISSAGIVYIRNQEVLSIYPLPIRDQMIVFGYLGFPGV